MKEELKELLKEHLKIKVSHEIVSNGAFLTEPINLKIEIWFDDALITKDKVRV